MTNLGARVVGHGEGPVARRDISTGRRNSSPRSPRIPSHRSSHRVPERRSCPCPSTNSDRRAGCSSRPHSRTCSAAGSRCRPSCRLRRRCCPRRRRSYPGCSRPHSHTTTAAGSRCRSSCRRRRTCCRPPHRSSAGTRRTRSIRRSRRVACRSSRPDSSASSSRRSPTDTSHTTRRRRSCRCRSR